MEAVSDEFKRLGLTPPIKLINDFSTDQEIDIQDGIVFCTYRSLIARNKKGNKRIDQITRWLGPNGIVIFDEGHRAKYAFADDRGKSTQTGAAVLEIQNPEKFPDVRVVYSSATSAGEVRHLAYMSRLGLWGEGTNFPLGFEQFAEYISHGLAEIGHDVTVYNPSFYKQRIKKFGKVKLINCFCFWYRVTISKC